MAFSRKFRLAIYFYEKAKQDQGEGEETGVISEKNALGKTQ